MERLVARLAGAPAVVYRRHGLPVLFGIASLIAFALSATNAVVLAAMTHALTDVPLSALPRTVAQGELVAFTAWIITTAVLSPRVARLHRRTRTVSEEDAPALWRDALTLPRHLVTIAFVVVSVVVAPVIANFASVHQQGATAVVVGTSAIAVGSAANCVFIAHVVGIALRPVVAALATRLPPDFAPPASPWTLRRKLLLPIPGTSVFTGLVVLAATQHLDDRVDRALLGLLIALLTAVGSALLFVVATRSLLEPIAELSAAALRVGQGDLAVQVPVVAADELGVLARDVNRMAMGLRERATLHSAFGAYVHPDVADRLLRDGVIEGEEFDVTVLFADLRGFTARSERSTPQATVALLNEWFATVIPVIEAHGGHVNKLLGDGLLAVFGAPRPVEAHADQAVAAARELVAAVHRRFGEDLRVGVGVNSGPVVAGTVGGPGKLDYTLIGDTVNVAARVEELTKELGEGVLLTAETVARLHAPEGLVPCGDRLLRGRDAPVTLVAARPVITRPREGNLLDS